MRVVVYFGLYLLFKSAACTGSEDNDILLVSRPQHTQVKSLSPEVYSFLANTLLPSYQSILTVKSDTIRNRALNACLDFAWQLHQSQINWNTMDEYLHWYETYLASSTAFTTVTHQEGNITVSWDYNRPVKFHPSAPRSGSLSVTVCKMANTFEVEIWYNRLVIDNKTITGRHFIEGDVKANNSPHLLKESFLVQ